MCRLNDRNLLESSETGAWQLVITPNCDSHFNMALDEVYFRKVAGKGGGPVVRLYGWNSPSVTIGRFQNIDRALNLEVCKKRGVTVVRRPTGGRLVYHGHDLTYSVSARLGVPPFDGGIIPSYTIISQWLVDGLKQLGISASLAEGQVHHTTGVRTRELCFSAASRYEIICQGRKLAGSAQLRSGGAMLQQGSVPLTLAAGSVAEIIRLPKETFGNRDRLVDTFTARAISVMEAAGRSIHWDEIAKALTSSLRERQNADIFIKEPTREELEDARKLVRCKYATEKWNLMGKQMC